MDPARSRPRLLIAMIEAGGGHRAPAMALAAALERRYPGRFDVDVLDIMRHTGDERLDARHKASWRWMLAHPRWTFAMQNVIDRWVPVAWVRWFQRRMLARFSRNLAAFVDRGDYDLLVATHFMPLHAAALARNRGDLRVRCIGVLTELFDGNALWAVPEIDEMIVATPEARAQLVSRGVPEAKLRVFGYPLGLPFIDADRDTYAARQRLGLQRDVLTVVHTVGGEGIGGDVEATVAAVLDADLEAQYVVITGRNERLRKSLQQLAAAHARGRASPPKTTLRIEGFTSVMADWIVASDVVLGKAGAASTFEALAMGRPIFHTNYVAGNEKRNVDYCEAHGIGGYVPAPKDVVRLLETMTRYPTRLRQLRAAVARLGFEPGTLEIASHLASLVEQA